MDSDQRTFLVSYLKHYNIFLLLFLGFLHSTRPRLVAGRRVAVGGLLSDDFSDFISIDCGAPEDYIDNKTGIPYKSDKNFVSSGVPKPTPKFHETLPLQFKYLRTFPEGRRNCYTLSPKSGKGNLYLIRASFFYGNHDGKNQPPEFSVFLDVTIWQTVSWESKRVELNYIPLSNHIDLCLVNIGKGVPYISALELRRLDSSDYLIGGGHFLALWSRYDVGGVGTDHVRYPDDPFDRMWKPSQLDAYSSISTNASINMSSNGIPYRTLPELMLKTAGQAQNSSVPLTYEWKADVGSSEFSFCVHFAETEKFESGVVREVNIVLNGVIAIRESLKLEYLLARTVCTKGLQIEVDRENNVSISATSSFGLPPILSGIEMFYSKELSNSSTFLQDSNAIMDIKQKYKLGRNWQGDPCNPVAFSWDGLNCSDGSPSRIISLNLSWSKLTGEIVGFFSNLTALESLDLSYNNLTGPLPESLARMPRLKNLNLIGNDFIGSIPDALTQKSRNGSLILRMNGDSELCLSPPCKKKKKILVPVLASALPALFLVVLLTNLVFFTRKRRGKLSKIKTLLELKNREFSYSEVMSMTDNFKTTIGGGGFGKVYLGALGNQTPVAVKLLSSSSRQGYKEFQAEAQLLMIVNHRHLVSLIGYCDEGENQALIYEYMANGNVLQHISESSTQVLNWMERLHVAVDAAQGLEYLHNGCKPPIIHRDMKTSNILLNEKMKGKIADFGLSRILESESATHLSTAPAGTFGYIAPEIPSSGNFTKKSDVYSFGIVLLELITGKPAIIRGQDCNFHIVGWIRPLIADGNVEKIVDSRVLNGGEFENVSMQKAVEVGLRCTSAAPEQRPEMSWVVTELTECLKRVQGRSHGMCSYASMGSDSILSPR